MQTRKKERLDYKVLTSTGDRVVLTDPSSSLNVNHSTDESVVSRQSSESVVSR